MSIKSDQIADALIHDVLTARYRAGERLPSERDLVTALTPIAARCGKPWRRSLNLA